MTLAERARRIPVLAAAEKAITGLLTSRRDLPIADYAALDVDSIVAKLPTISQTELRTIAAYEATHGNRVTVNDRITSLTGAEPWPGYDDQNITAITATLADHDVDSIHEVASYERAHKDRAGIREAIDRHERKAAITD